MQGLKEKLEKLGENIELTAEISRKAETLKDSKAILDALQQELFKISQKIENLKKNLENIDNFSNQLKNDARPDERIEIFDVVRKITNEWCIKIRSADTNEGYFRNVKIIDVEDNIVVCELLLIEPGTEIKLKTENFLNVFHHLIGKIDEKIVSFPFRIPKVKILSVTTLDSIEIALKNLSDEEIQSASIICNGEVICNDINLNPLESHLFNADLKTLEISVFYVECNQEIISNSFQASIDEVTYDFSSFTEDLNDFQAKLFENAVIVFGENRVSDIKAAILRDNPESSEELYQLL